eukprot:1156610-Pelagomonas_calceolata.AAC.3
MWAVPSRSTKRAMVCPGSFAAIACAATSFPTLPFWTPFPLEPRILPLVRAPPALKVMWVELLPIKARTGLALGGRDRGGQRALKTPRDEELEEGDE